jgi:hypothetical protein
MKSGFPGCGTPQADDWYWDHDLFDELPEPNAIIDTDDLGSIRYQGDGEDPAPDGFDVAVLIRKWRKLQTNDLLMVYVPKEHNEAFKQFLKSIKGSIATID